MRRRVITKVKCDESGMLILDFLVKRYRFKDEREWSAVLCDKMVMLNGLPAGITAELKEGDEVLYEAPEAPEPQVDRNIAVIFEDEQMIAVNKTGNLPCHPSGIYQENTLLSILKERLGVGTLHLINRLDRETSGVVLLAKDGTAAKRLSDQFLKRTVRKSYSVLVEGKFPEEFDANGWLIKDEDSAIRKKRRFVQGTHGQKPHSTAEWAETRFELIKLVNDLSLVNVELMTGRLHQIRATLCSLGYPVVGDKMYGVDEDIFIRFISDSMTDLDRSNLRINRQALHARELHIKHPLSSESLVLQAPIPADMLQLLNFES